MRQNGGILARISTISSADLLNRNQWIARMLITKKDHLEQVGLFDLFRLLKRGITQNPSLIQAALTFWDPAFNCFRFPSRMMAPTVLDVSQLIGLIPYGPVFDIATTPFEIPFPFPTLSASSRYNKFLNSEMKTSGEVTDSQQIFWLFSVNNVAFKKSGFVTETPN